MVRKEGGTEIRQGGPHHDDAAAAGAQAGPVAALVESRPFRTVITTLILINAVVLGLDTAPSVMAKHGSWLRLVDNAILLVFVAELLLKLIAYRLRFFASGWNIFDFLVVGVSLAPATSNLSILRALRVLRVMRLLSVVPSLRRVVEALIKSLPGMGAITAVLCLVFYVGAVLSTKLFGAEFDAWFGTIGRSMYTLFQIMTLESWSMGIVRPVMDVYPHAWTFFVPFIFLTSFMVLNLFIGIIVNSLHLLQDVQIADEMHVEAERAHGERDKITRELAEARADLQKVMERLDKLGR